MPINFTERPFGVPKSVKDSAKVNKILERSFAYQKMFRVTNACGFVSIILKYCFEMAGINMNIVYGTIELVGIRHPHVWLEIHDHIVDNTYADIAEDVFKISKTEVAVYSTSFDGDTELFLGDQFTNSKGIENHSINVFKWFLQNQNKALVMYKNKMSLRSYYQSMVRMMKEKYDVIVPHASNNKCWSCGGDGVELRSCTRCKIALYCNRKCQKKDWKCIHKELCLPPNTP